jgi:hypothetical protein
MAIDNKVDPANKKNTRFFGSRLNWVIFILIVIAILLIMIGSAIPDNGHWVILHLMIIHIGIGVGVACLVAVIFDHLYHDEVIGKPLRDIDKNLGSTKSNLTKITSELREIDRLIVMHNNVLGMTRNQGIIGLYRRDTEEFVKAAKEAVQDASKFTWTMGRTHRKMLIVDGLEPGWLLPTILEKITDNPEFQVQISLANTFDNDTGYRRQLLHLPNRGQVLYHASRDTVKGLLSILYKLDKEQPGDLPNIVIRLFSEAPSYALLMTEKRAFVECYLPFQRGGTFVILEVSSPSSAAGIVPGYTDSSLYAVLKDDFNQIFKTGEPVAEALQRYCQRVSFPGKRDVDPNLQDLRERLLPIAERLSRPDLKTK